MFDIGFSEIALLMVIGLLALGPEKLPAVARTAGRYLRRARRSWEGVKRDIEKELDAEELKKSLDAVENIRNPLDSLAKELNAPIAELEESTKKIAASVATKDD